MVVHVLHSCGLQYNIDDQHNELALLQQKERRENECSPPLQRQEQPYKNRIITPSSLNRIIGRLLPLLPIYESVGYKDVYRQPRCR